MKAATKIDNGEWRMGNRKSMRAFVTCAIAGVAALAIFGGGCAPVRATAMTPVPNNANAELMEYIGDQPFLTAEAGYRAAYVFWKGQPFDGDFAGVRGALVDGGIAAGSWSHDPADCLDRATAGYLICRACGINSGINWPLTGLGRYAWKELQYRQIAQPSGEMGLIGGGEFLGVLAKAEDYARRSGAADLGPKAELGAQPTADGGN